MGAQIYDWTDRPIVPRGDLIAWNAYRETDATGGNAPDLSGNGRAIVAASNTPVLTMDVLNGQPGWLFNGARNPFVSAGGATIKHAFILLGFAGSSFSEFQGVLTGSTVGTPLISNNSGNKFFDASGTYPGMKYRKNSVFFASSNQVAPIDNVPALIEISSPQAGVEFGLDAIQVGKDRNFAARLLNGYWFDQILYSAVKNDAERQRAYEYFAMRYWIWPKDATDTYNVFPFAANKTRALERDKENYLSEPYEGDPKALVRGDFKNGYSLQYLLREQAEWDAAVAFFAQHRPLTPFVLRDYRYYPYREVVVRFTSSIREQGSDVSYRFNYSFDVVEAT
jgi:hypothetical protein